MEFTNSRYCKTSRMFLMFLGQWPYQKSSDRKIRTFCSTVVASTLFFTQFMKFVRSYRELDMFEAIPPTITALVCAIKLHGLISNKKKLEFLQKQINDDWNELMAPEEIKIMEEYAIQGEIYSVAYMYIMFSTLTVYIMFIFEPFILDIISPLDETRPLKLLYPAEFFIDEQKYFVLITIISVMNCIFMIIILVAFDTMLITYVQYICGMLAVIGYRLEYKLYKYNNANQVSINCRLKRYKLFIMNCVCIHDKALILINLLDSTFMLCQLIVLGLNVLCLSITLVRIAVLLGSLEMCRYTLYAFGQLIHILYVSYQSERLINHSLSISNRIYCGKWYTIPKEIQKMLLFISRRASIPSYLTAGKMFIYSIQNFSMVVQNCMSYFMALVSFQ